MSTLRTDNLQTTDSSFTIAVNQLVDQTDLSDAIASIPVSTTTFTTVDTVAAARALNWATIQGVQTKGYYSAGDGGAQTYVKDTTDTTSTDNGGSVLVSSGGVRLKAAHNGFMSLKQWGARGNGTTNDSAAFQAAVNAASASGISLLLGPGNYLLTSVVTLPASNVVMIGSGNQSILSWGHTGNLFNGIGTGTTYATYHTFEKFKITGTVARSTASYAFNFGSGIIRSNFRDIELVWNNVAGQMPYGFINCNNASTMDTIVFDNIELNGISGVGFNLCRGSSVWFHGGRVIGPGNADINSIGLLLNGDMGGVWIWGMDFIHLGTGVWTANNGAGTNREIFLSQGCCDSCGQYGYRFSDNAYVSATGLWAASCRTAGFLTDVAYNGVVNVSGGTIFNNGVNGGAGDGFVINSGQRITLTGLHFRNNVGYGIRCTVAAQPTTLIMTGCMSTNNANNSIGGAKARVDGCNFQDNASPPIIVSTIGNCRISNTTGINDTFSVVTPGMAASGAVTTVGGYVPLVAYISGGTVSNITVNGVSVMATSNISVPLSPGDTISITYTAAPVWTWVRADL